MWDQYGRRCKKKEAWGDLLRGGGEFTRIKK